MCTIRLKRNVLIIMKLISFNLEFANKPQMIITYDFYFGLSWCLITMSIFGSAFVVAFGCSFRYATHYKSSVGIYGSLKIGGKNLIIWKEVIYRNWEYNTKWETSRNCNNIKLIIMEWIIFLYFELPQVKF